jgi:hypothetical protein
MYFLNLSFISKWSRKRTKKTLSTCKQLSKQSIGIVLQDVMYENIAAETLAKAPIECTMNAMWHLGSCQALLVQGDCTFSQRFINKQDRLVEDLLDSVRSKQEQVRQC